MTDIIIKRLNIISFGKFKDLIIGLDPEFNLIYGLNESGKSTIRNFIEGIFYGFDEGKTRVNFSYKKEAYKPKDSYSYQGELDLSKDGINYRIYRNFDTGEYIITNTDLEEKLETKASDLSYPGKFFLDLDYDLYKNFIVTSQMQSISKNSKEKVLEKLLSQDIDYDFSIKNSLENLDKKLAEIGSDRAYTKPYYKISKKIESLTEEISYLKNLRKKFAKSYKKLKNLREELRQNEERYKISKLKNDIYNKRRSDENFKEYKKWTDKLYILNNDLEKYGELSMFTGDDFEKADQMIEKNTPNNLTKNIGYIIIVILFLALAIASKKYYIILLVIPILIFFIKDFKSSNLDFSKFGVKNLSEYNKLRRKFFSYKDLLKKKEELVEVIDILKKQDLDLYDGDDSYDFDFSDYDNLKASEKIRDHEKQISALRNRVVKLEKDLLTIDNELKDQAFLEDELKSLRGQFEKLNKEIKAIKLAKKTITSIRDESKKDVRRLNTSIEDIVNKSLRTSFKVDFDENLKANIRGRNNHEYDINQLSQGFFDQVNFSLKYSLVKENFKGKFLVFDDAFINYDIERLMKSLFFLLDMAYSNQIIYFTCHEREKDFFRAENIAINFIDLEDI